MCLYCVGSRCPSSTVRGPRAVRPWRRKFPRKRVDEPASAWAIRGPVLTATSRVGNLSAIPFSTSIATCKARFGASPSCAASGDRPSVDPRPYRVSTRSGWRRSRYLPHPLAGQCLHRPSCFARLISVDGNPIAIDGMQATPLTVALQAPGPASRRAGAPVGGSDRVTRK